MGPFPSTSMPAQGSVRASGLCTDCAETFRGGTAAGAAQLCPPHLELRARHPLSSRKHVAWLSEQGESERGQMVVTLSELLCPEPWVEQYALCPRRAQQDSKVSCPQSIPWAAACSMRLAHKGRRERSLASLGFTVLFFPVPRALLLNALHDYTHFISCSGKVLKVHTDAVQLVLGF